MSTRTEKNEIKIEETQRQTGLAADYKIIGNCP